MKLSFLLTLAAAYSAEALVPPSRSAQVSTRPTNNHLAAKPIKAATTAAAESSSGGTATIPNEVFNLVKSIVGAGVLSLPAGTLRAWWIWILILSPCEITLLLELPFSFSVAKLETHF
jgi:hypothetical protein